MFIKDLMINGKLLNSEQLQQKFKGTSWLWYRQLTNAIPGEWKKILSNKNEEGTVTLPMIEYTQIIKQTKPSRKIYSLLNEADYTSVNKYLCKWNQMLSNVCDIDDYFAAFVRLYKITAITKLREFQYRLLLNKIFCNDVLFRWKLVYSPNCEICNDNHKQDTIHLLIKCKKAQVLWKEMKNILQNILKIYYITVQLDR